MAKEYVWDVTFEGEDHHVSCVLEGNRYVLYLDDDLLDMVYRNTTAQDDFEFPITICGKACLFIVWDTKPDLVVDGIMLSRDKPYHHALTMRQKDHQLVYWAVFWFGITILLTVVVFGVIGFLKGKVYDDILFYAIGGTLMVIYGHPKTRWLTHPKNSPIIVEENNEGADLK